MGAGRARGPLVVQSRLGAFLRTRAFSPREKEPEKQRGSERQPEREAALPTPTHGP